MTANGRTFTVLSPTDCVLQLNFVSDYAVLEYLDIKYKGNIDYIKLWIGFIIHVQYNYVKVRMNES